MQILSKPWFIAVLALVSMVGTQFVALKMYWTELFPEEKEEALVVRRDEPEPFAWGFSSEALETLEKELKTRHIELDGRQDELDAYEKRLIADRAEIEEIKQQVERMQESLLEKVIKLEAEESKNLKTLAKTYSTLTPEAAVNIFQELDDSTVVKIMFFMKTDIQGAILETMAVNNGQMADQVKRAAKISDMLRLFTDNSKNNLQQNI